MIIKGYLGELAQLNRLDEDLIHRLIIYMDENDWAYKIFNIRDKFN